MSTKLADLMSRVGNRLSGAWMISAIISGVALLIAFLIGWCLGPYFIHREIAQNIQLKPGSEIWDKWVEAPVPVYLNVFLFNVTNPSQVTKGSDPIFKEIGPYVYREKRIKTDIRETLHESIFYKEKISYYFVPELSNNLTEDDHATILNIPFVALSQKISELTYPLDYIGISYVSKFDEQPFITKRVKEIFFDGWNVPILNDVKNSFGIEVMPNSSFGLFVGKNGSDDGQLEVDAGISSMKNFGKILSWKGMKTLSWWKNGSHCNDILGTDGSIFPPLVTKDRVIYIFNSDLCRSLYLTFTKETSRFGIPAYRFSAPKSVLEDPKTSAENRCFCNEEEENTSKCLGAGAIDLSPCQNGAPVAMSTPHFLNGDVEYIRKAGLSPNEEDHATILDIEPTSGIVLKAHKRIQLNVKMRPVKELKVLKRLPKMLFPVVWMDEWAQINESIATRIKSEILEPFNLFHMFKWVITSVFAFIMVVSILCLLLKRENHPNKCSVKYHVPATQVLKTQTSEKDQGETTENLLNIQKN